MSCEDETLRDRGRRLRAGLTDEERKLWAHLRAQRLRFWNEQVNTELEGVLQAIHTALTDS